MKLLEENIGRILHAIGFGNNFLDMSPKVQGTKQGTDKLYFITKKYFVPQRILST